MTLPRSRRGRRQNSIYNKILPAGSWWRKLVHYALYPILVMVVLFLFTDSVVMPIVTRHGGEFELPDVTAYQVEEAENLLTLVDLGLETTSEEYHPDKPEGTILSQYPASGTMVKAGRVIKVVISSGQKLVKVPVLAGYSVRQAKLNIEAAGLVLGDIAGTFTDSLPEKVVVFSYPAAGTEIPVGAPVNLMVNRGNLANVVYMPRLVGKPLDDARMVLDDLGLKVGLVTHIRDENYLPETVLEQSVEEAAELELGEEIDLIVTTTE